MDKSRATSPLPARESVPARVEDHTVGFEIPFLRLRSRESGLVEGDNFDVAGSPEDFNRYCVFMATKSQVYACFSDFQITDADMG